MTGIPAEQWRPVVGYEGAYEVSDRGQVRSLPRPHASGRILRPGRANKFGHLHVSLWLNGSGKSRLVHHLVLEAFTGPRPDPPPGCKRIEARHLDGNPAKNLLSNLAWGTSGENKRDAVTHGTHNNARKTECDHGHEFTPENTYDNHGGRGCMECKRKVGRESYHRNKEKVNA